MERSAAVTRPSLRTLRILRPANALTTTLAVLVGAYLAARPGALPGDAALADPRILVQLALAALAAFAFAAAGNVRNDLLDVEVDRRAHPERALVRGELTPRQARALAVGLYALSLACAAAISLPALVLVALALPLMEAYERRLKAQGLAGNLAVAALTAAPFVLGALALAAAAPEAVTDIGRGAAGPRILEGPKARGAAWLDLGAAARALNAAVLATAALAALATAGREVLKDSEDADADAGVRRTLPHRIGPRRAAQVAAAFLWAAVILSPMPWLLETVLGGAYIPAVAAADACFGTAAWMGTARPGVAQRLAKVGMLLALVALVIGRAQGGGAF